MSFFDKIKNTFFKNTLILNRLVEQVNITEPLNINTVIDIEQAYRQTPVLAGLVNYCSMLSSKGKLYYTEKNGDSKEVNFGNLFDSSNDNFYEITKNLLLYNYCFIKLDNKSFNVFDKRSKFTVISPFDIDITFDTDVDYKNIESLDDFITEIKYKNSKETILLETLILIKSITIQEIIESKFRIRSVQESINIIRASLLVHDGILRKKGGLGVIMNKDIHEGQVRPMKPGVQEDLQKDVSKFGFTRKDYNNIITAANVGYLDMTPDVRKLHIPPAYESARLDIADSLGIDADILNTIKGATFTNKLEAEKQVYKSVVISIWEKITDALNNRYLNTGIFEIDTSTIEALQSDLKTETEISNLRIEAIYRMQEKINSGLITLDMAKYYLSEIYGYKENQIIELIQEKSEEITVNNIEDANEQ